MPGRMGGGGGTVVMELVNGQMGATGSSLPVSFVGEPWADKPPVAPSASPAKATGATGSLLPVSWVGESRADKPLVAPSASAAKRRGQAPTLHRAARRARRRGIAAVEFALVCVPLFVLMVGLIDYGIVFLKVQQITQAARAGARAACVADATNDRATAVIDAWMAQAEIASYTIAFTPSDVSTAAVGSAVKVEITVPTGGDPANLALIRSGLVPVPENLVAAASMAKE